MKRLLIEVLVLGILAWRNASADDFDARFPDTKLQPLFHNNPGLVIDLGVGLWGTPLPCDFDGDGDMDLLVASPDVPSNGIYFFENTEGNVKYPVFRPGVWLCPSPRNITISYLGPDWRIISMGNVYGGFKERRYEPDSKIEFTPNFYFEGRDRQWKLYDYDGDGLYDLVLGASDWREYGWDNAFNTKGEWTRGPLHGYVYVARNLGTNDAPVYSPAEQIMAGGKPVDVFGTPSPNFEDFDRDGDLDLVCGEFLDKLSYFENMGTRRAPRYAEGHFLEHKGEVIRMELQMLQVTAVDWDRDGDVDLVVGQEDGRVALVENSGTVKRRTPVFLPPRFFRQEADRVKVGALATPFAADWDGDDDQDLIVGDTAGFLSFVENLGGNPPKWAAPVRLQSKGRTIRIQAGMNGSIQGPAEAKWGYTVPNVADWNNDGLLDVVINSIWGEVLWYRNRGTRTHPVLDRARPIEVEWDGVPVKPAWVWWNPKGNQLVTQWRTMPCVIDLNKDGLNDLVMLDHEGYLAFFERRREGKKLALLPGQRIFHGDDGQPLQLNKRLYGGSGRRQFTFTDWDGDERLDLILDSENMDFWRNVGDAKNPYVFHNEGKVDPHKLAGHATCPTTVDWDHDDIPDLLIGAEDGFLYYLRNPRSQ